MPALCAAVWAATPPTTTFGTQPLVTNPFDGYAASAATATASSAATSDMQGSFSGTPGLWNIQFAETLAPGQTSASAYVERYSRDPGALVFTDVHTGMAFGITRWLEFNYESTGYRRIRLNSPEQLTFARTGAFASYNPAAPFARNPLLIGPEGWNIGLTAGILSQDRGQPVGLAVQVEEHFPMSPSFEQGVNTYGVGTTEPWTQVNLLLDRRFGHGVELAYNFGYQYNSTADPGGHFNLKLPNQFNYGAGVLFPLQSRIQGIVEVTGNAPNGMDDVVFGYPAPAPIDLTGGVRVSVWRGLGLNAGYRYGANAQQMNRSGFVFGVSYGPLPAVAAPPPPPPAPTLSCSVDQTVVQPGATVHITTSVSPTGLPYTYSWTTTGGQLSPSDASATLGTAGLAPGMYTVTARVNNGSGGTADCQGNVEVREAPRNPPTASCSVDPSNPVLPGAAVTYSVQAASPDNRPLTYTWSVAPASAGHLDATNQASAHLDTTGASPGTATGSVTVSDDRGLTARCSADATIQAPPPPPQAALAATLQFKPNSSRVDNAAKAALDDVALRLQQDATARAVIVGFATSTEVAGRKPLTPEATLRLAEERAVNAKAYLVKEKGIAADRIEVRHDDGPQKAEVWVVPQGANYMGSGQTFDENALAAPARRSRGGHAPATRSRR